MEEVAEQLAEIRVVGLILEPQAAAEREVRGELVCERTALHAFQLFDPQESVNITRQIVNEWLNAKEHVHRSSEPQHLVDE